MLLDNGYRHAASITGAVLEDAPGQTVTVDAKDGEIVLV
jgi:hypothetical protein